ncbi:hypothetical protein LJC74_08535 [Eubacteriales bacterium OttesenSCG-928-A19]|nr:hypothetical protein [Eubacteriales bacterium OttesenSCG-928-A19]
MEIILAICCAVIAARHRRCGMPGASAVIGGVWSALLITTAVGLALSQGILFRMLAHYVLGHCIALALAVQGLRESAAYLRFYRELERKMASAQQTRPQVRVKTSPFWCENYSIDETILFTVR